MSDRLHGSTDSPTPGLSSELGPFVDVPGLRAAGHGHPDEIETPSVNPQDILICQTAPEFALGMWSFAPTDSQIERENTGVASGRDGSSLAPYDIAVAAPEKDDHDYQDRPGNEIRGLRVSTVPNESQAAPQ